MYAQILRETIGELRLGSPVSDGPLVIMPLRSTTETKARYVLLQKAIERGRLTVTEVDDAGSVPYLVARNRGPWPVLVFDGEELVGAKQNRIANATILVGVGKTVLPVSCVEQGRWSRRSHAFSAGAYASHPSLRSLKERQVREASLAAVAQERSRSPEGGEEDPRAQRAQQTRAERFRSRQGEVWDEVEKTVDALGAYAPTRAMADSYEAGKDEVERLMQVFNPDSLFPAADAVGAVVLWEGDLVCLDLLWPAKRFGQLYPKLLRGYALEALMYEKLGAKTRAKPSAKPLARKDFDPEAFVLRLLGEILDAEVHVQAGVDLGEDLRLETKRVSGAGLGWRQELIQLSVFPRQMV
jgi:hypothetical protein